MAKTANWARVRKQHHCCQCEYSLVGRLNQFGVVRTEALSSIQTTQTSGGLPGIYPEGHEKYRPPPVSALFELKVK